MIVLVIPVAALLFALVWVRWARHPDKPLDELAQVEAHRRSLDALAPDPHAPPVIRLDQQPERRRMPQLH